jgi:hypothetical protein
MTKFVYFNDTKRIVSIHPATITHGCEVEMDAIQPLEERVFTLPEGTYVYFKMWDYGEKHGLQILVSPRSEEKDEAIAHEPTSGASWMEKQELKEHLAKRNPHDKKEV